MRHIRQSGSVIEGEWQFNDAWYLVALGRRRDQDLSELIGSADALNHDVLPALAAAATLGRLLASGLAERRGERFRLSAAGERIYERRRGGVFEEAASVLTHLREVELVDGEAPFAAERYDAACEEHRQRVARWMRGT